MAIGNIVYSTSSSTIVSGQPILASNFQRSTNLQVDTVSGNINVTGGINVGGVSSIGSVENLKLSGGTSGSAITGSPIYLTTGTYTNFTRRYDSPVIITGTITVVGNFRIRTSSYIDFSAATITSSGSGEIMLVANGYNPNYPGTIYTPEFLSTRVNTGAMAINCGAISIPTGTVKLLAINSLGRDYPTSVLSLGAIPSVSPAIRCNVLYIYSLGQNVNFASNDQNIPNFTLTASDVIYPATPTGSVFEGRTSGGDINYRTAAGGAVYSHSRATIGNNSFTRLLISRDDMEAFQNITWGTTVSGTTSIEWKKLGYTNATPITASGNFVQFDNIPENVKKITLTASGLQVNPSSSENTVYLRLGSTSSTEGSGYTWVIASITGSSNTASRSTGSETMGMPISGKSSMSLTVELYLVSPELWLIRANSAEYGSTTYYFSIGYKFLVNRLSSIRLALANSGVNDNFVSGIVNITYK